MIFILRASDTPAPHADLRVVHTRKHPTLQERDLFCVGAEAVLQSLREAGGETVPLHDGWYPDDSGGGVAVWGNGRYWEVRSSPFEVVDQG